MNDLIAKVVEMIEERKAIQTVHLSRDREQFNDPFLCQHMRGRVAVEENDVEWLDKLLAVLQ